MLQGSTIDPKVDRTKWQMPAAGATPLPQRPSALAAGQLVQQPTEKRATQPAVYDFQGNLGALAEQVAAAANINAP
jgi:hypothetical protein